MCHVRLPVGGGGVLLAPPVPQARPAGYSPEGTSTRAQRGCQWCWGRYPKIASTTVKKCSAPVMPPKAVPIPCQSATRWVSLTIRRSAN